MVEIKNLKTDDDRECSYSKLKKVNSFEDLNLKYDLLRGIYAYGFENPSDIQRVGIFPIINRSDVICQANSGSGKTGTFVIGSLQLLEEKDCIQILVISPTKELATQTFNIYSYIGQYMKFRIANLFGGTDVEKNREINKNLKENKYQIIVGTPGKITSYVEQGKISLADLKLLILDEADDLLKRGFIDNMKTIISKITENARICLVSATMPLEILSITKNFLNDPVEILLPEDQVSLKGISQFYCLVKKEWKLDTLINLFKCLDIAQLIIFCNNKSKVVELEKSMTDKGFSVGCIHSDLSTNERSEIMLQFRSGVNRVLISTDLTARGIDVSNVSMVINYDLPYDSEQYIHRIGRSGRYGKKGNAINFVTPDEYDRVLALEKKFDIKIEKLPTDISNL